MAAGQRVERAVVRSGAAWAGERASVRRSVAGSVVRAVRAGWERGRGEVRRVWMTREAWWAGEVVVLVGLVDWSVGRVGLLWLGCCCSSGDGASVGGNSGDVLSLRSLVRSYVPFAPENAVLMYPASGSRSASRSTARSISVRMTLKRLRSTREGISGPRTVTAS